ncbi:hypothetical protein [Collimonas pratensis]|nr:hypothetical protein [Collimonas pratensis]
MFVETLAPIDPGVIAYVQAATGGSKSPYYWSDAAIAASSVTSSGYLPSLPPAPDGTYRTTLNVGGKAYFPLVANCPAAGCMTGNPIASALGDPATTAYQKAVQQDAERDLNIASLALGIGGTLFRAADAVVGLFDLSTAVKSINVSETVAAARVRQATILQDNVGFNISPTAWDAYPTIGRNGTFVSDQRGIMGYFGNAAGKSEITVAPSTVTQIENDMGLVPGSLQDGFKVRQVTGVRDMSPVSPLEGNQYFLGAGNHLPGGAPEMVINSIPTIDNSLVNTILKVKVDSK